MIMMFNVLNAATWGDMAKKKEKGFFDFEFITWMAWTWQTAAFFIFIVLCLTAMVIWEKSCLLYTSPSPRDLSSSRMPSSA